MNIIGNNNEMIPRALRALSGMQPM